MARPGSGRAAALAIAAQLALLAAGTASAAAPTPLSFVVGIERVHDDNILQLTAHGFDRFSQNPDPPRFLIVSPDDAIHVIRGDVRWSTRPLPRRETRLAASVDANEYQRNRVKNWQEYEVSLRQELTSSRRNLSTLEISWADLPRYYLGEITDADASFEAGTRIRKSLDYAQVALAARLEQELFHGRLVLGAGFERLHRDYGASFEERDNDNDQWRAALETRPFPRWGLTARVAYLEGTLTARGDLESTPIRDTDISYRHSGLGAGLTLPWGRGSGRGRLVASWMPERRVYSTSDKFDLLRFGRTNRREETTLRVYQSVWGPFEAVGTYDRLTSRASFTQGIDFDPDVTDFVQTRLGLMLRARWELLRDARANAR